MPYSVDSHGFSLLDINHVFKRRNNAPQIDKFTGRPNQNKNEKNKEQTEEERERRLYMLTHGK